MKTTSKDFAAATKKKLAKSTVTEIEYFDEKGVRVNSVLEAVAYRKKLGDSELFWVTIDKDGKLYDPRRFNKERDYRLDALDRSTRSKRFKLRQVGSQKYARYMNFLRNPNNNMLLQAEREQ